MQYQVPQFIEIEDKIFGPLTFKQFLYVGGGAAVGFIIWTALPGFLAILVGAPVVGFFMMAAFYKVNGRPFLAFVEGALKFALGSKLYIWHKTEKSPEKQEQEVLQTPQVVIPKLSQSKLRDVSWGLDVQDRFGEK